MKYNINQLSDICKHINNMEINASRAERDSIKFKQTEFLMDQIGTTWEAVITGVTDWGVYAEIIENKCEGMINKERLLNKGFELDSEKYSIESDDSTYRLGDVIDIRIDNVNLQRKEVDFDLN